MRSEDEECILLGIPSLQCSKLRRLKFPVISIVVLERDVSMVIVAGSLQQVHSNKNTDKNTL